MLRRKWLVLLTVVGFLVLGSGVAEAGGWDLVHERTGYGRVTLRAWTSGYNQVAFVADHGGTRISVDITVSCRDGYFFEDSWSDGGRRFRYIVSGLNNNRRCNHTFRVEARSSFPLLDLTVWARG